MSEIHPILIVDDESFIRSALQSILSRQGYELLTAATGEEAKKILEETPISMIICDQQLPGTKGVDVLKNALELQPDAVRIGLTGLSDLNTFKDMVNIGHISHFILKPWDNDVLINTVQQTLYQAKLQKENTLLQEEIRKQHAVLTRELQLGGKIQNTILLGKVPTDLSGLDIEAISLPSKSIDGDFFEFYRPSHECFDIVLADVMGKGLPAALVGTAVKTHLTRYAAPVSSSRVYSKSSGWRKDIFSPEAIMAQVQSKISKPLIDLEYFVCLSYARIDLQKRTLTLVDCGATKPIIYRAKEKKASTLKGSNFPLGMIENDNYSSVEVPIKKDDLIVFYSDGVTEALNPEGEQFGDDRLLAFVEKHHQKSSGEIIKILKKELIDFCKSDTFNDDLTVVAVRVTANSRVSDAPNMKTAKFASDLSQLQALREFIEQGCKNIPGDAERMIQQLQLAVNEAFCNIVEHGYQNSNRGEIEVDIEQTYEGIVLNIKDQGKAFDPSQIEDPSFAGDKYGGFGLFMIKQIADVIAYSPKEKEAGWNQLTLSKYYLSDEVPMNFSHQQQDDILTITLESPSLDAKEAPTFKQEIIDLIADNNANHVIMNLQKLNFIDSSGLGSFLSILRQLNSRGGDLKMAGMNKSIRTVFELVCMHKIFEIYNTPEDAVKSYRNAKV